MSFAGKFAIGPIHFPDKVHYHEFIYSELNTCNNGKDKKKLFSVSLGYYTMAYPPWRVGERYLKETWARLLRCRGYRLQSGEIERNYGVMRRDSGIWRMALVS
jgi:hypothetical protein